ncbi:MAG: methylmalonyl-CoA mutase, partial [Chitinophagia bacterium]|nr:methylmalonyl-CoA mutase [Chitinophagia bacterium]
ELQAYGITRIYSPDDGRKMGLQGMIDDLLEKSDFPTGINLNGEPGHVVEKDVKSIARLISAAENFHDTAETQAAMKKVAAQAALSKAPVLGITGTGGAGKSSLVDEVVRRFLLDFPEKHIGIISVDPSKRKTGGALLGDRIRMNAIRNKRVYMRSMATRQSNLAVSKHIFDAVNILKAANYDLIVLETSGIGQSDTQITDYCDLSLYVMTPEYGAATQLEKIDMLDFADVVVINKFDKRGALDALRDVKKQYQRNHKLFDTNPDEMPVYGTIASQFNDPGTNTMYKALMDAIATKTGADLKSNYQVTDEMSEKIYIIPPNRTRYLSEISENNRQYNRWAEQQADMAEKVYAIHQSLEILAAKGQQESETYAALAELRSQLELDLDGRNRQLLEQFPELIERFKQDEFVFQVRGKDIRMATHSLSLSQTRIPKVSSPRYRSWGDQLRWLLQENFPGYFPYTSGVFPFKRDGEDPTRMFAGEGGPERTNRRFHYVSKGLPAARLSTAFDSVTLYGNDPGYRPDIYGKIGNSGVSICCLDDAKKLYSGFDLCAPSTSVSMTINGPAAMLTAFFMNAAIDQQCEKYIHEQGLQAEVQKKIEDLYAAKGQTPPAYYGNLPEGNDGLGLLLLGVTG